MQTVLTQMQQRASEIASGISILLQKHSKLRYSPHNRHPNVVVVAPEHWWEPLPAEGQQLQSRLLEDYRKYFETLQLLLRESPKEGNLLRLQDSIVEALEQRSGSWERDLKVVEQKAKEALAAQVALLESLFDSTDGECLIVPDTNALLFNPSLEKWGFSDTPKFTIVFTPSVLSELDQLKINHRVESVREKAEGLIRRIKELRRRGSLLKGVTLVTDLSRVIALPIEPDFEKSLSWLDPANNDDRIIASMFEIIRQHTRSEVILVTRDINLQHKAEFAGLPFQEPPV